jgi:nucleotide-binding universal stress UspA family protein
MIGRVLLAVDDSPAALAAIRAAVELCAATGARLRALTVIGDHHVTEPLGRGADAATVSVRQGRAAQAVLRHVERLCGRAGVAVETAALEGEAAPRVLDEARRWAADLIVLGRVGHGGPGQPYVGGQTRHVLEFADVPVLVVPPSGPG